MTKQELIQAAIALHENCKLYHAKACKGCDFLYQSNECCVLSDYFFEDTIPGYWLVERLEHESNEINN